MSHSRRKILINICTYVKEQISSFANVSTFQQQDDYKAQRN